MSESSERLPLRVWTETIPTYAFPENAARALGKVAAYASWRSQPAGLFWGFDDVHVEEARAICRAALARGDTWLNDGDIWGVLNAVGLPAAVHRLAHTADEAAAFASVIALPPRNPRSRNRPLIHASDHVVHARFPRTRAAASKARNPDRHQSSVGDAARPDPPGRHFHLMPSLGGPQGFASASRTLGDRLPPGTPDVSRQRPIEAGVSSDVKALAELVSAPPGIGRTVRTGQLA